MATKLNFRARNLDSTKPLAIYHAEDLPELQDTNNINRAVPALPTGMEKEEETEKHLQDILFAQTCGLITDVSNLVIPIPECDSSEISTASLYKGEFKQSRQYIHVQPFGPSQDLPDYDMDEEDLKFFREELRERRKLEVSEVTFEDMIDRLEKNSSLTVVTLGEAKRILKEDDDLILLVYDYWLNKRLELQHNLMPTLRTSASVGAGGQQTNRPSPYVAFRRRTEKMQTRKNRKNDEATYEAMLKLRRDLGRAVTLLEIVKKREKTKKEKLNLTLDVFDKRYQLRDYDGKMLDSAVLARPKTALPPFSLQSWTSCLGSPPARRTYKKRKQHRSGPQTPLPPLTNSSEDETVRVNSEEEELDSPFIFRRREGVQYLAPLDDFGNNNNKPGVDFLPPYILSSFPLGSKFNCQTFCRRRLGRGGRVVVDRAREVGRGMDDKWERLAVRPVTPPSLQDMDWDPYRVRGQEVGVPDGQDVGVDSGITSPPSLSLTNNKGFRILDRAGAHNAARALVDSQFVDLFSTTQLQGHLPPITKL